MQICDEDISIVLVGTKSDLSAMRAIDTEHAERLAADIGMAGYIETSARMGTSVQGVF